MSGAIQQNAARRALGAPASRPLRLATASRLASTLEAAIASADGLTGAHCIHELWMRGELAVHIESALERLWGSAAASIPDWLPMRHIEWLPLAYEVAARFQARRRGRSNIYLVLLDYRDSRRGTLRRVRGRHALSRPRTDSISTRRGFAPPAACCAAGWNC